MMALVLAMALTAQPNIFEPSEMSSEAIFGAVSICIVKAKTEGGVDERDAIAMCGCMMDAVRLNSKRGLRPPANNTSPAQLDKCKSETARRRREFDKKKDGKTGT